MFKRRTSKLDRSCPVVLEARIRSPRLLWLALTRAGRRVLRFVVVPAVLLALVAAGVLGLQRAFLRNRDFKLALIDLNDNPVLDEQALVGLCGIDLEGSVFAIDTAALERQLEAVPAIAGAAVSRELPGTLRVRIDARAPVAWLELPQFGVPPRDPADGWLVDAAGLAFPAAGFEVDGSLPVVVVGDPHTPPPLAGAVRRDPELTRALDLLRLARGMAADGEFVIERIEQDDSWSIHVRAADGLRARFGLSDHERQFGDLLCARRHALERGYKLATIDLIPERNIPVTLAEPPPPPRAIPVEDPDAAPPPRAVPVAEPLEAAAQGPPADARERDLRALLGRD